MIITYHGKQFFKIQHGETIFAINPISKDNTLDIKPTKFGSDVALCSVRHPDYNGFENAEHSGREPFKIYGPGSYEVQGNSFVGFPSKALIDGKEYINTIYFFTLEDISFCFLGDLASHEIDQKTKEYIDSVDVIFVPIGGEGTLDAVTATKAIKPFSPKAIIPMDYGKDREKNALESFLKETGSTDNPELKYVFKKKDIESLTGQVIVIQAQ